MAHCLPGRGASSLLTDIIAGRCVSGTQELVLVPSEDVSAAAMIRPAECMPRELLRSAGRKPPIQIRDRLSNCSLPGRE